jgi:diacylglycerol kinase (ATP)
LIHTAEQNKYCDVVSNKIYFAFIEAHPERFNSRLRNKMFYGQAGGKDLLQRKWKDLSDFVTLECDGKDMTPKLKEHKVHAIVCLNIAR